MASTIYKHVEFRGRHARLDWEAVDFAVQGWQDYFLPDEVRVALRSVHWASSGHIPFRRLEHVNIQEARAVKQVLKDRSAGGWRRERVLVGVDSRVVLGAWGKGRSSSRWLNAVLRAAAGWSILSGRTLFLFWVPTDENFSDPPSRNKPLPEPAPCPPELASLICPERSAGFVGAPWPRSRDMIGLEIFGGAGGLTAALERAGVAMEVPIEAWPKDGVYRAEHDIHRPEVASRLTSRIASNCFSYTHIGLPCTSWSAIQRMNGGTRRKATPEGDESRPAEVQANSVADLVALWCRLQVENGKFFSLENPRDSYVWDYGPIARLRDLPGVIEVVFDQCLFGLGANIDGIGSRRVRKSTRLLTNVGSLIGLARACPGEHKHLVCLGHVKVGGRSCSLPRLAGCYPQQLCTEWASLVRSALAAEPPGGPVALR